MGARWGYPLENYQITPHAHVISPYLLFWAVFTSLDDPTAVKYIYAQNVILPTERKCPRRHFPPHAELFAFFFPFLN